jgi:hypothetical protein
MEEEEKTPRYWLFAPHGFPVQYELTRGWQGQEIAQISHTGNVLDTTSPDFPDMDAWPPNDPVVLDADGNEFLIQHCRLLEVHEGFRSDDSDITTDPAIEPWPDHIVKACIEAARLSLAKCMIDEGRHQLPNGFVDDTLAIAFDTLILGKIDGMAGEYERQIAEFREGRTEPTVLEDQSNEGEDHVHRS